MRKIINTLYEIKTFLLLWITQSFSGLGSAITSYALVIWSYSQQGSALVTALLMVCSYAPYVLCSVFAGAISDRWNRKKTILICDGMAAVCTLIVFFLLKTESLRIWHLYAVNAVNGLMNTVQQPASEVAVTAILPKKYYQKVGGIRYFSSAMNSILTPVIATAILGLFGMDAVILFDLFTFMVASLTLLFWIRLPEINTVQDKEESLLKSVCGGLRYLKEHRGILDLILFLAAINLVDSMYNAAFPAMMLSRSGGSEQVMGIVNTVIGVTTLLGSILASFLKAPKSRVRVICNTLLFSMSFENFLLAFGRNTSIWCLGGFLGWIVIPIMSTNLDAILRLSIPAEIQGRVFAARNSFQFFTIPLGYFLGGFLVDQVFEPIMCNQKPESILIWLFGQGKGTGAAFFFSVLAVLGIAVCVCFRHDKHIWSLEERNGEKEEGTYRIRSNAED